MMRSPSNGSIASGVGLLPVAISTRSVSSVRSATARTTTRRAASRRAVPRTRSILFF